MQASIRLHLVRHFEENTTKNKCKGFTKAGNSCQAPAVADSDFCFVHSHPERARRLGRDGGRKNRRSPIDLEVPDNIDISGVRKVLVQALRTLASGDLEPRTALAITQLCNALQRSLPIAELQDHIITLRQKVADIQSKAIAAEGPARNDSDPPPAEEGANGGPRDHQDMATAEAPTGEDSARPNVASADSAGANSV